MRIKFFIVSQMIFLFCFTSSFAQVRDTLLIYYSIDAFGVEGEFQNDINNILKKDVAEIYITSYTDFLGTVSHNNYLSNRRANEVKQFLILKGVKANNITECSGKGIYPTSSSDDRTNPDDRGVVRHRVSQVVFIYSNGTDNKNIAANEHIDVPVETDEIEIIIIEEDPVVIPIFANLSDANLVVGSNIILDNILFEGGTPIFKRGSESALNQLLLAMEKYPDLVIEIQGHICCQYDDGDGWDRVNQNNNLSENRAEAVYNYLVEKGVDSDRMTYIGFGSKHKRFPEERSPREEDLNRRVEIRIVEK